MPAEAGNYPLAGRTQVHLILQMAISDFWVVSSTRHEDSRVFAYNGGLIEAPAYSRHACRRI